MPRRVCTREARRGLGEAQGRRTLSRVSLSPLALHPRSRRPEKPPLVVTRILQCRAQPNEPRLEHGSSIAVRNERARREAAASRSRPLALHPRSPFIRRAGRALNAAVLHDGLCFMWDALVPAPC
jgi:hypothetical protein